jgi:hypothetical protein
VIDERIALPKERAPEQYVAWGPNSLLKLLDEDMAGVHAENIAKQTLGKGKAKPFEQWSVDEVCRLIKSIDGVGYAEAADVIKEIGIDGKYFASMLRNSDEDLTKSIANDGLGFKKLQLKVLKAKIEESQAAES